MPRIPSYAKLPKAQLIRIIEDGHGARRTYTRAQATRAAEELESREMGYQNFMARQPEARENTRENRYVITFYGYGSRPGVTEYLYEGTRAQAEKAAQRHGPRISADWDVALAPNATWVEFLPVLSSSAQQSRANPTIRTEAGETLTVDDANFKWFVTDFISRNREAGVAFSVLRELGGSATLNQMQNEFPDRLVLMKGIQQLHRGGLVERGGLGPGGNRTWRFVNR